MLELSCKVSQASVFELSAAGRIKFRFSADSHSLRCARSTKAYADEPLRDRACQAPILRGFESHLTSCDVCRRFGKSKRDSKLFKDAIRRQYQNFFMISVRLRAAEGSAPVLMRRRGRCLPQDGYRIFGINARALAPALRRGYSSSEPQRLRSLRTTIFTPLRRIT